MTWAFPRHLSIVLREHDRQDWLSGVARADMGNDLDGFRSSWGHQEAHPEIDPVRVGRPFGCEQRQRQQIMESARHGLPLASQPGWWLYIMMVQVVGDHRGQFETRGFRLLGDVNENSVSNRLCPGVAVDDVSRSIIGRHFQHHPVLGSVNFRVSYGSSL